MIEEKLDQGATAAKGLKSMSSRIGLGGDALDIDKRQLRVGFSR